MTKTCPDCAATVLSTSRLNRMDTTGEMQKIYERFDEKDPVRDLIERLRNPMWVHSPAAFDSPQLEQEDNLAAMNEAADKLAALAATPAVGGEPVAWRYRWSAPTDALWETVSDQNMLPTKRDGWHIEPLYTAQPASPLRGREIAFGYTNYRGEYSSRKARPISVRYGTSEYHKVPEWLMLAFDVEKNAEREFAMSEMVLVEPADVIHLSASPPEQPAADPVTEIQPHIYSPDYQAMGDCRVCGHERDKPWHALPTAADKA